MRKALAAVATLAVLLVCGVAAQKSPAAATALEAAIRMETVDGDLRAAIRQYQQIVEKFSTDRPIAAQALLRLAACYKRVGSEEARAVLERVIKEYPEQQDAVQEARAELGSYPRAADAARARRVAVGDGPETHNLSGILMGTVSRDGRFLCYTGGDGRVSNLMVRNLLTGTERLVLRGGPDSYPDQSSLSSDGQMVAYVWWNNDADRYELRVVAVREGAEPRVLLANPEVDWIEGLDWAPDNATIAAQLRRADGSSAIGLVSVATGSLRVLESFDWRWTSRMFFSPDGKYVAYDFPQSETDRNRDLFLIAVDGSRKAGAAPHGSNDRALGWSPDGTMVLFVSDRAGEDSLWGVPFDGRSAGTPVLLKRGFSSEMSKGITKTGALYYGIPHVSGFDLKVSTFDFERSRFDAPPRSVLTHLIPTAADFDWSPDGNSVVYVVRPRRMEDLLVFHDISTGDVRQVRTAIRGIGGPRFMPDGRAVVVRGVDETKHGSLGLHRIDLKTGETELLVAVGGPSHRPEISPDGTKLYYRRFLPKNEMAFLERDLRTGAERALVQRRGLGMPFLSPDGRYLATGSRDAVSRSRAALLIPTIGGSPVEALQTAETDQVSILMWAPDSQSFFVRKVSNGKPEVWQVPVNGSPHRTGLDVSAITGPVRVAVDGKRVAYQVRAVSKPAELWALENFLPGATSGRR